MRNYSQIQNSKKPIVSIIPHKISKQALDIKLITLTKPEMKLNSIL